MSKKEKKKVEKKEEIKPEVNPEVKPELIEPSEKEKEKIYGIDINAPESTIIVEEVGFAIVNSNVTAEVKVEPQQEPKKAKEPKEVQTPQVFEGFRAGSKAAALYDSICAGKDIDTIVADWVSQFGGDTKKHKAMISQYVSNWKKIYGMKIDKRENRYFFVERPC